MKNGINRLFYSEIIRHNCVSPKMSKHSISHEDIKYNDIYWWLWWMVTGGWFKPFYRTCWIVISNLYIVFTYVSYITLVSPLFLLGGSSGKHLFYKVEEILYGWILELLTSWSYTANLRILESGDCLDSILHEPFLFLPNHQSTADIPICMGIFASRNQCAEKLMWIMDDVFKFTHFGIVSWIHDDFFIQEGKDHRSASLMKLKKHVQNVFANKNRKYLILFPEGGFLRKRKLASQNFARKNDLPVLNYCTLPRLGAVNSVMQSLSTDEKAEENQALNSELVDNSNFFLSKAVDVTIAYPNGNPLSILDISFGSKSTFKIYVHYKIYDIKHLQKDQEGLRRWMYNIYYEKEKLLKYFYKTGTFPRSGGLSKFVNEPRELLFDPLRFIMINVFFLMSTYIFSLLWTSLYLCIL